MTEIDWQARAEAAEAERDEALTALGEHVIATEHDRDEYLALQRVIVQRDNELEAAEARIAAVEAIDWAAEINWSDGSAHYLDAERLVRAALVEPVGEPPKEDA